MFTSYEGQEVKHLLIIVVLEIVLLLQYSVTVVEIKSSEQKALNEITSSKPWSALSNFFPS